MLHPDLGPPDLSFHKENMELFEHFQNRDTEIIRWLECLLNEDRLKELDLLILEKRRLVRPHTDLPVLKENLHERWGRILC